MSLSNTERQNLLSAALDGELSNPEQVDFDRAIAEDVSFAREFAELQVLRTDVQSSLVSLRQQKLSAEASSKILNSIAEASKSTDFAARSKVALPPNTAVRRFVPTRWVMAGVALAASLLIAVKIANRNQANSPTQDRSLASINVVDIPKQLVPESPTRESTAVEETPKQDPLVASIATADVLDAATSSTAMESGPDAESTPVTTSTLDPESIAVSAPPVGKSLDSSKAAEPAVKLNNRKPLAAVAVLAVELSPVGRERLALQEALRASGIRLGPDSVMASDFVSNLKSANLVDVTTDLQPTVGKLLFIEASAKSIDRFVTMLFADKESFVNIGFNIATDLPLLAMIGDLRESDVNRVSVDAPAGLARTLVFGDSRRFGMGASSSFVPLDQEVAAGGLSSMTGATYVNQAQSGSASEVKDFYSHLLLLVK